MENATNTRETLTWDEFGAACRDILADVADSGRTLALAVKLLEDRGAEVRSAVIYTKPTTIMQPDYSYADTSLWIDFPWSFRGSVIDEDTTDVADA